MYRILNKLFGWDYVCWKNSCGSGIARIHIDKEGKAYYWRYKNTNLIDYLPAEHGQRITWLTCHPSKYIKQQ